MVWVINWNVSYYNMFHIILALLFLIIVIFCLLVVYLQKWSREHRSILKNTVICCKMLNTHFFWGCISSNYCAGMWILPRSNRFCINSSKLTKSRKASIYVTNKISTTRGSQFSTVIVSSYSNCIGLPLNFPFLLYISYRMDGNTKSLSKFCASVQNIGNRHACIFLSSNSRKSTLTGGVIKWQCPLLPLHYTDIV